MIINVVGARPQFVKAGPVSKALERAGIDEVLLHTGQHYDDILVGEIMADVGLRDPDINLGVGSGPHGRQTAAILDGLEEVILDLRPSAVITYGDTNSTIAAALAASKQGVLTAHVEAGLRSGNRHMPEELNRIVTDQLSDILFAPTQTALDHLESVQLGERAILSGDVMVDALMALDLVSITPPNWAVGDFFVSTLHRPSNVDNPARLRHVLQALGQLESPVHLLVHPRLRGQLESIETPATSSVRFHSPITYSEMMKTISLSSGVITDSGGLQKESFLLGVPCTTIRNETEWPETLVGDWNRLVGDDLDHLSAIVRRRCSGERSEPFGDGHAARRIAEVMSSAI
jgi:UDP-N-acetylglucosamine 2-epimerase (non-hydrolysing)